MTNSFEPSDESLSISFKNIPSDFCFILFQSVCCDWTVRPNRTDNFQCDAYQIFLFQIRIESRFSLLSEKFSHGPCKAREVYFNWIKRTPFSGLFTVSDRELFIRINQDMYFDCMLFAFYPAYLLTLAVCLAAAPTVHCTNRVWICGRTINTFPGSTIQILWADNYRLI